MPHEIFENVRRLTITQWSRDLSVNVDIQSIANAFPSLEYLGISANPIISFLNPSAFIQLAGTLKEISMYDAQLGQIPLSLNDLQIRDWLPFMNNLNAFIFHNNQMKGDSKEPNGCHFDLRGIDFPWNFADIRFGENDIHANLCIDSSLIENYRENRLLINLFRGKGDILIDYGEEYFFRFKKFTFSSIQDKLKSKWGDFKESPISITH